MGRKLSLVLITLLIVAVFHISLPVKPAHAAGLAIDGTNSEGGNCNTTCTVLSVGNANANDICFVTMEFDSGPANSVISITSDKQNAHSQSFNLEELGDAPQPGNGNFYQDAYLGTYTTSGAVKFTVQMQVQSNVAIVAACFSGSDITTVFDTDTLKGECQKSGASSANPSCSPITTKNPNDLLLGFVGFHGACPTLAMGSGFTNVATQAASTNVCESQQYEIVSSTQSSITQSMTQSGSTQAWDFVTIAICQSTCGQVTLPIKCTLSPVTAPQPLLQLASSSGAGLPSSVVPSSITCDGLVHNIAVSKSSIISASNPTSSSTSGYAFSTSNPSGLQITVCSSANPSGSCPTWSFTDYYEIVINNPSSLGITYNLVGVLTTGNQGGGTTALVDANSPLTISGQYINTIIPTKGIWIYQENFTGIQIYGDEALTNIIYSSSNLFLKFSAAVGGASSCHCQGFIPPTLGLTLQNVYNNGAVNTAATFNNNLIDETGLSPHEWDLTPVAMMQSTTQVGGGVSGVQSGGGGAGGGPPPIIQIQITSTTATILNQTVVLVYPTFGNPGLIGLGITILGAVLVVVVIGFAFNARRSRRREYNPVRHF